MHSSLLSRCSLAIAAVVLFTGACSDSSSEPKQAPPAQVEVVAGEDQSGAAGAQLPDPIIVAVLDAAGRPVPNTPMTFQVVAGGGSIEGAPARTDAVGLAEVRWTLGTTVHVEQRLEARALGSNGATLASTSILATAGPAAPARLEIVPPGTQGSVYPGVRVLDQFGNPVPGVTVTFTVIAGGGTVEGATVASSALGIATVGRWTLGEPGANTLRASSGELQPVTYTIMQQSRVPARVILSAGQGQTAMVGTNVPIPPSVIVQNDVGTPLSDIVVTFTPGPNSGNVTTATVTTGTNGMATLGGWFLGTVAGPQTLVASASPTAAFTFTAEATAGSPRFLDKIAGDAQVAAPGATLPIRPAVIVRDAYSNVVPNATVTFSVYNGGGTITDAPAVSNSAGVATGGSWTLGPLSGTQTLRASAPGVGLDAEFTARARLGIASLLTAHPQNPTTAIPGREITLSVIVLDDVGDPLAGVPIDFAPISGQIHGGGTVIPPARVTSDAQGVASVRYVMPTSVYGNGGVVASGSGMQPLQMNVNPLAGPPKEIRVTLPSDPVVAGGDLGRPVFSVVDEYGTSLPMVSVTFTVVTGSGRLDGGDVEKVVTTASPPATSTSGPLWTSGPTPGVNTLVVSMPMLPEVPSVEIRRTTVSPP